MNISCNIIRDLLPLYAEDMVSDDSREMVDEHLCECGDCVQVLEDFRKRETVPAETSPEALNKVKKMIVRRRSLTAVASVLTILTVISLVVTWFVTPFQLTAEEAVEDFYVEEDGTVVIDYAPYVAERHQSGVNKNWFLMQYSCRYAMLQAKRRPSIEELCGADGIITEEERQWYENIDVRKSFGEILDSEGNVVVQRNTVDWNWWYADPSGKSEATLLYDAGKPKETPQNTTGMYPQVFFGTLAASVVLLFLRRLFRPSWLKELCLRFAVVSGSIAVSLLFVSSGSLWSSYVGVINQYWGSLTTTNGLLLSMTFLFWRQLWLLNKLDRL